MAQGFNQFCAPHPGAQHDPRAFEPFTTAALHPPLAVVAFHGHGFLGMADHPMPLGIGAQGCQGHGGVELAIGRGIEAAEGSLGQGGLQALELGRLPEFQGEALGLTFLAEPPLALQLLPIAGEEQQTLAVRNGRPLGLERLDPFPPQLQAALAEPPAPSAGAVEHLAHQDPQGCPAA